MHVTCLTIGSRGDVQPYLALCKELQKDGHRCRIATHPEYEDWVTHHGIEFRSIGGDPGELMVRLEECDVRVYCSKGCHIFYLEIVHRQQLFIGFIYQGRNQICKLVEQGSNL